MGSENTKSSGQSQIDENLKRVFQQTLDEDIPDRFKNLLNQLKDQERGSEEQLCTSFLVSYYSDYP